MLICVNPTDVIRQGQKHKLDGVDECPCHPHFQPLTDASPINVKQAAIIRRPLAAPQLVTTAFGAS
jgi:hypothetical protein